MSRIPYPEASAVTPELRQILDALPSANVFRILGHGGPISQGFLALGGALRGQSQLDPVLRELIIVRVGILCRAKYEVHHHTNALCRQGIAPLKISALQDGPESSEFTEDERTVLRFVDAIVLNVKAGQSLFSELPGRLSNARILELIMLVGHYMMVCRILENLEVEIEADPVLPRG